MKVKSIALAVVTVASFISMAGIASACVRQEALETTQGQSSVPAREAGAEPEITKAAESGLDRGQDISLEPDVHMMAGAFPVWRSVPIVSKEILNAGSSGGEGGQWPHTLEVSGADSSLLFYGTNTGGLYRSEDGGNSWKQASTGFQARGCNAIAADPMNASVVLAAGISDKMDEAHGIYLSGDGGRTWAQVLRLSVCGNKRYEDGLEFDKSSYDAGAGRCLIAYYSTPYEKDDKTELTEGERGLYRTTDGGFTWSRVNSLMSDAEIKTADDGTVYAARFDGLYMSKDQGATFETLYSGELTGFDASWTGGYLVICDGTKLLKADLGSSDFKEIESSSYPRHLPTSKVAVSPADSGYMLVQAKNSQMAPTEYQIYYSHDGGASWSAWHYDKSRQFLPYSSFEKQFAWSHTDKDKVWSFGGEGVIRSSDGGKNWSWNSDGISGIYCGGKFHFNIFDPDLMYFGAQDWNGAMTRDGGRTWSYVDLSGKTTTGHVYGAYAASKDVLWGFVSDDWDGPKRLRISFDGGRTYKDAGRKLTSAVQNIDVSSYQSYNKPDVFFAGNLWSRDGGRNWERMEGCAQVYTHNPTGSHELYGCEKEAGYAVVSYDDGDTWTRVNAQEIPLVNRGCLSDVQIDPGTGLLYVAANGSELYAIEIATGAVINLTGNLPADEFGAVRVNGVAVDPNRPGRIYVTGTASRYNRVHTVLCSEDGGATWQDMTPAGAPGLVGGDEVNSAMCIQVHPATGEVWCSTACYGFVKLSR